MSRDADACQGPLAGRIRRLPRAWDEDLAGAGRQMAPYATGDLAALIGGAAGSSPYLAGLIRHEAEWLEGALDDPEAAVAAAWNLGDPGAAALGPALRQAKRRVALIAALADLGGVWPLEQVTGVLSAFADRACANALRAAIEPLVRRGRIPGQTETDLESACGMVVLAMGKMGAGELNYSSDIDLICLFDETRFDRDAFLEARTSFVRATRAMCALLSDRTADGYVFRTDLRLRPDPAVTPVCIAMEAAERYYESLGRTWERAAYIKARPAAGDLAAGQRFLDGLRPFVWRRHLDFAAIEDAHDMRLRIRAHKGKARRITVPGHDMKLGRGGIREIEFFTQTRQLIAGGRDPALRPRGTVAALAALAEKGWVPDDVASGLSDHYRAHREVEHRIQMIHDAQTHAVPQSPEGLGRLAALMGRDRADMESDLRRRLEEVHALTEGFFAQRPRRAGGAPAPGRPDDAATAGADALLSETVLARWLTFPAFRTQRAAQIFDRLKPDLARGLAQSARPEEAMRALEGFLAGLPAGVQIFSLFQSNPQLVDLLIDIVGTAPELGLHLSRNAHVFDAVLGGDFFDDWPGAAELTGQLSRRLENERDYEARLDAARVWTREWRFRIGVHLLRGLTGADEAGRQYADLADAVIAALWPAVTAQFAQKHGPPPGRGAAVLGMGSLGSGRLTATSDLDVIVIYDPAGEETSRGPRALPARTYYARLTQAMITALTAPMAQGRLYEVDMRLRPSGNQGPVATSLTAFRDYQLSQAWIWEHLALTRARIVAGPADLARDVEAFRREIMTRPREVGPVLEAVADMRARLDAAKTPAGPWDTKTGAGRMLDIELLAQAGALLSGTVTRDVESGLHGAVTRGWLDDAAARQLAGIYGLLWQMRVGTRLLSTGDLAASDIGQGGASFLRRLTGENTLSGLEDRLRRGYDEAAGRIDAALQRSVDDGQG
ncbi:MAG: bifunctional [glutamine synthetase] adenylyltransferase/[glutamine synthetase]-adenylyl-L-tyrosine phosphorylase [Rhodobacteraceae bacterium]|nr:bifunctional [glutamine synthetase] adenylyltransferase/[glutamine synthetase]-adenylyl-L-tyrosine phosphorylase [Paracoccaceae bacterium]